MCATIVKSLRKLEEKNLVSVSALLIVMLGSWAFIDLAREVDAGATQHFDEWVMRSTRRPDRPTEPIGPAWLADAGRDATALGGYTVLILLVTMVAVFLRLDGKRGAARFLLAASLSGFAVGLALKAFFNRPRPTVVPHLAPVLDDTSFPSAHAMMSAVVYLTVGALLSQFASNLPRARIYVVVVALLLTGLVGVSRVYLGVHYPTDVLAGWTAGLVWATLCASVAKHLQRRGLVETGL